MSCHGCASKFGFWTKENGCPACGFSFCNSCLKNKCAVPKLENKVCKVCNECYNSITNVDTLSGKEKPQYAPPAAFLKRLEALDAPKPPVTVYRAEPRMQNLMKGLNSTDLDIVRRLEKLREDRKALQNIPSEDEIANRLAALRGQDENQPSRNSTSSYVYQGPDTRSAEQRTQDLFSQCQEELKLDSKLRRPEDEIEERLSRLREGNDSSNHKSSSSDDASKDITLDEIAQLLAQCHVEAEKTGKHVDLATIASLEKLRIRLLHKNEKMVESASSDEDEATAAEKILAKVQAEVDLEKSLGIKDSISEEAEVMDTENETEELPWCIICNEDAKICCLGCDGDLFCKSCFQEGHQDEDMRTHKFEPFPKK